MKTERFTPKDIVKAGKLIKSGELVAFPTETVYGLGANALDANAARKIFVAKERPFEDPLIVHCDSIEMVETVAELTEEAYELAKQFWPGPMTLILKKKEMIPDVVSGGLQSVAVRIPAHPIALKLIQASGVPIAAPSANKFTRISPTDAKHVLYDLDGRIAAVIDGGATKVGVESTIVDLTSKMPRILRPGGLSYEKLQKVLPDIEQHGKSIKKVPGNYKLHYSPKAKVVLVDSIDELMGWIKLLNNTEIGVLAYEEWVSKLKKVGVNVFKWGKKGDVNQLAKHLYRGLHTLDEKSKIIFCPLPKTAGIGDAIVNRLKKASGK